MAISLFKNSSKGDLEKEKKLLKAELAVLKEAEAARIKAEEEIELLKSIILSISNCENLHAALSIILEKVCEATGWILGQAWIPDQDNNYLACSPLWYTKSNSFEIFRKLSTELKLISGVGLPGRVWKSKMPLWVRDVTKDNNFPRALAAAEAGLKAGLAIPILSSKKEAIAIIEFFMLEPREEDVSFVSLITTIARQLETVFQRKLAEDELRNLNLNLEKLICERTNRLSTINKELVNEIKERIYAESALKQSETGFRLLFANNPNPMFVYDLETLKFLEVNNSAIAHYGYSKEEFLSLGITDIRPVEDIPKLLADLREPRPPLQFSGCWKHLCKDGRTINVEITSHTLRFNNKNAVLVVVRDLTEQLKVERSLHESTEQYKKLVETANDAIFVADVETGLILDANKKAEELIGLPLNKLIGMHQSELHPEEERDRYKKLFIEHVKEGHAISEELYICNKLGNRIPVEISASVTIINGKKIIQGVFRDLRKWKQAEITKSQLSSLVKYSPDALISIDLNGNIINWNPAAESMYGYKEHEVIGEHVSTIIHENENSIQESIQKFKSGVQMLEYEAKRTTKDGSKIYILARMSPIKNEQGIITGISAIVRDITKNKLLQNELAEIKQNQLHENELYELEKIITNSSDTITQLFKFEPLCKSSPNLFSELVNKYKLIIKLKEENSDNASISDDIKFLARQLGLLKAAPSDAIEIHTHATNELKLHKKNNLEESLELNRGLLLELISDLTFYYRSQVIMGKSTNSSKQDLYN